MSLEKVKPGPLWQEDMGKRGRWGVKGEAVPLGPRRLESEGSLKGQLSLAVNGSKWAHGPGWTHSQVHI